MEHTYFLGKFVGYISVSSRYSIILGFFSLYIFDNIKYIIQNQTLSFQFVSLKFTSTLTQNANAYPVWHFCPNNGNSSEYHKSSDWES